MRYCDEILDAFVRPYAAAIGNDFILMDDNAQSHQAVLVEDYLESQWNGQLNLQTSIR